MLSYHAVKLLSRIICLLPHGTAMALGELLARLAWHFIPAKRKTLACGQVMRCLGVSEDEADRIARVSSLRFGPMLMEVRTAIAAGKGAIFATSHSGNWELMGGAFACAGFPLVGVAKRQSSAGMDRFINEYRALVGMHVTYRTGVREMFRMIGEGWIIGLLSDQDPSLRDGVIVDFFGQKTNAFTGAAAIARRCEVPILNENKKNFCMSKMFM